MFRIKGFLFLCLSGLSFSVMAASPVGKPDIHSVLMKLQQEIAAEPVSNQSPIDTVMARHADNTGIEFHVDWNESESGEPAVLAKPANVSKKDWQAFLLYWKNTGAGNDIMAEGHTANYILTDIDSDGKNDLILYYYMGGTGLYSYIEIGKRDAKNGFVFESPAEDGTPTGYSINGRGADQTIYYLRIDGRFYVGYRDGVYGRDVLGVYPGVPETPSAAKQDSIVVRYRYQHTALQPSEPPPVWGELLAAANKQLGLLKFDSSGKQIAPDPAERCPAPEHYGDEDASDWPWHGAGHYTFDYVADFRVKTAKGCYSASIMALRNSYLTSNDQCCTLQLFNAPGNDYDEIPLKTQRERTSVSIEYIAPGQ